MPNVEQTAFEVDNEMVLDREFVTDFVRTRRDATTSAERFVMFRVAFPKRQGSKRAVLRGVKRVVRL